MRVLLIALLAAISYAQTDYKQVYSGYDFCGRTAEFTSDELSAHSGLAWMQHYGDGLCNIADVGGIDACYDICASTPGCEYFSTSVDDYCYACFIYKTCNSPIAESGYSYNIYKMMPPCTMDADTAHPNWYGAVAIPDPNFIANAPSNYANHHYEWGPLTEKQCQDLCLNTPTCNRMMWKRAALPLSCWMWSSIGAYAPDDPEEGVAQAYDKNCVPLPITWSSEDPTQVDGWQTATLKSETPIWYDSDATFACIPNEYLNATLVQTSSVGTAPGNLTISSTNGYLLDFYILVRFLNPNIPMSSFQEVNGPWRFEDVWPGKWVEGDMTAYKYIDSHTSMRFDITSSYVIVIIITLKDHINFDTMIPCRHPRQPEYIVVGSPKHIDELTTHNCDEHGGFESFYITKDFLAQINGLVVSSFVKYCVNDTDEHPPFPPHESIGRLDSFTVAFSRTSNFISDIYKIDGTNDYSCPPGYTVVEVKSDCIPIYTAFFPSCYLIYLRIECLNQDPTVSPSTTPSTPYPSDSPISSIPSATPTTPYPSVVPSIQPSMSPSTPFPSVEPSTYPSADPSQSPSESPPSIQNVPSPHPTPNATDSSQLTESDGEDDGVNLVLMASISASVVILVAIVMCYCIFCRKNHDDKRKITQTRSGSIEIPFYANVSDIAKISIGGQSSQDTVENLSNAKSDAESPFIEPNFAYSMLSVDEELKLVAAADLAWHNYSRRGTNINMSGPIDSPNPYDFSAMSIAMANESEYMSNSMPGLPSALAGHIDDAENSTVSLTNNTPTEKRMPYKFDSRTLSLTSKSESTFNYMIDENALDIDLSVTLGSGNFGSIYGGEFRGFPVALKYLEETQAYMREGNLFFEISNHLNVCRFFGICVAESLSKAFLVMELYQDGSILNKMENHQFTPLEKLDMCLQIANGLWHIHGEGVIHCDLGARNVLIKQSANSKYLVAITDFGLSCRANNVKPLTQFAAKWASPELMKSRIPSFPSDVWALGCVYVEICQDGRQFYEGISRKGLITQLLRFELHPKIDRTWHPRIQEVLKQIFVPIRSRISSTQVASFLKKKNDALSKYATGSTVIE